MNKKIKLSLIREAQNYLVENPVNLLHEITHHHRVLQRAYKIVKAEKLALDEDVLEIVCWWHDVKVPGIEFNEGTRVVEDTAEYLKGRVDKTIAEEIYDSVLNHEFKSEPKYIEGKVLQDADKLDILSVPRFKAAMDAVGAGKLDKVWFRDAVIKVLEEEWLPFMLDDYHFDYSKNEHKRKLPEVEEYLKIVKNELL